MLLTSSRDDRPSLPIHPAKPQESDDRLKAPNRIDSGKNALMSKTKVINGDRAALSGLTCDEAFVSAHGRSSAVPHHSAQASGTLPLASSKPLAKTGLDGLNALQHTAKLNARRKSRVGIGNPKPVTNLPGRLTTADTQPAPAQTGTFAAPLSPLRERDLMALAALFERDDIHAIEADVSRRLLSLLPEPCWEDDVFDFLKEFL